MKLRAGQRALFGIRCSVSGTMMLSAVSFLSLIKLCFQSRTLDVLCLTDLMGWVATCTCIVLLALAPLPGDVWLTRLVLVTNVAIVSVDMVWNVQTLMNMNVEADGSEDVDGDPVTFYGFMEGFYMVYVVAGMGVCLGSTALILYVGREAQRSQELMWKLLNSWFFVLISTDVICSIVLCAIERRFISEGPILFIPGNAIGISVASCPQLRKKVHHCLRRMYTQTESMEAAAGIASLVGHCSVKDARKHAAEMFRCVQLRSVAKEDMATSAPDIHLSALAVSCKLGSCDAFISHSWHDCAETKWRSLQSWLEAFVDNNGREPSVWWDKCCIDQANIERDLRSLPLFLSGCSRMVICCGLTYLRRLWCIMEIFTFVHMGGDEGGIDLFLLLREGREHEDREAIREQIDNFDALQCECFDSHDKERMLFIIRTAYSDIHYFNLAVREILDRTYARELDLDWGQALSPTPTDVAVV